MLLTMVVRRHSSMLKGLVPRVRRMGEGSALTFALNSARSFGSTGFFWAFLSFPDTCDPVLGVLDVVRGGETLGGLVTFGAEALYEGISTDTSRSLVSVAAGAASCISISGLDSMVMPAFFSGVPIAAGLGLAPALGMFGTRVYGS